MTTIIPAAGIRACCSGRAWWRRRARARSNHEVINAIAQRLGVEDPRFSTTARAVVAETFRRSNYPDLDIVAETGFVERARPERAAHFAEGFGWPDRRYRFAPDWQAVADRKGYLWTCDPAIMPRFADHWDICEKVTAAHPFKLATSPARAFLNSSFNETPGSRKREGVPSVLIHPEDTHAAGIAEGDTVELSNARGAVRLTARLFDGLRRGVLIAEGLHPNRAHAGGQGINVLTSAEPAPPFGGVPFHDTAVALRKV
jgi:anaerobic selenocysteine-containing dehydrogenase